MPPEAVEAATTRLEGWRAEDGGRALLKTFRFTDFARAFGFMAAVAVHAERRNHHPQWSNVHSTVEVRLSSHDAGGVTDRDVELARFMDEVAG